MQPKLGILAGGGRLPADIIDICQRAGRPFFVIAFKDQAEPGLCDGVPHIVNRLGAAGRTLQALRDNDVEEIIFVGGITRPKISQIRPDLWGVKFLAQSGALALGDDGFLTTLVNKLERDEGFRVVGIDDIAGELLTPRGDIGALSPGDQDQADIRAAVQAALDLGEQDIGQAVVARHGDVIGLEDEKGTDALLMSLSQKETYSGRGKREGVLAKVAKPQQERRADLPTIGVATIENAANAGLRGIVVEAGGSIILERDKVAETADRLGLFVLGIHITDVLSDAR